MISEELGHCNLKNWPFGEGSRSRDSYLRVPRAEPVQKYRCYRFPSKGKHTSTKRDTGPAAV